MKGQILHPLVSDYVISMYVFKCSFCQSLQLNLDVIFSLCHLFHDLSIMFAFILLIDSTDGTVLSKNLDPSRASPTTSHMVMSLAVSSVLVVDSI